jgi:hypothetical protein
VKNSWAGRKTVNDQPISIIHWLYDAQYYCRRSSSLKENSICQEYRKNTTDEKNYKLQSLCVRHGFDSLRISIWTHLMTCQSFKHMLLLRAQTLCNLNTHWKFSRDNSSLMHKFNLNLKSILDYLWNFYNLLDAL